MSFNTEVKGTLAKLLATENLTVEHRKVSTASFDVNNRVLVLPIWKNASGTVYDLLVGHEVGHALYTPNIPVNANKGFVNVLEDVRIEKKMKVTYPGLRKSFYEGYRELNHRDFFGVAEEGANNLAFIDRINLHYKGTPDIEFTIEEQIWVDRAGKTETFEEVLELANELYDYAKELEDKKEDLKPQQQDLDLDFDLPQDTDEQDQATPDGEGDELTEEQDNRSEPKPSQQPQHEPADLDTPSYKQGGDNVDETHSATDESLQQALETLVDDDAKEWIYLDLPKLDLSKIIIPHTEVQEDLHYHFNGHPVRDEIDMEYIFGNITYAKDHYRNYKKEAQKSVNYLVKQFEMKKSADEYQRTATSKSGVIDTNALFKYRLTDDIFKRIATVQEGKNHGLVMYLDWSGSMQHELLDTIKQAYNLVWFCRKAGIPFRVYGFQSAHYQENTIHPGCEEKKGTLTMTPDFRLIEFFSSRQNKRSLDLSMELIYLQAFAMNNGRIRYMMKYTLGGTPLVEAVMCTPKIVDTLKKVENVTKVNVICLTDGEANPMMYLKERNWDDDNGLFPAQMYNSRYAKFILRDPKSGVSCEINNSAYETTKEIVRFYRKITDYNWVGIRICSKKDLQRICRAFDYETASVIDKQWKKEKFASIKDLVGFTQAFYMPDKNLGVGTQQLEVNQKGEVASRAELSRAFKKHMGSKMTNKTILNAFIEQIA